MAHTAVTLTRDSYTEVADAGDTVSVQLPTPALRVGRNDMVELITATSSPTVPTDITQPNRLATILRNSTYEFVVVTNITVGTGEKLYGRWLGTAEADDLYVVTF